MKHIIFFIVCFISFFIANASIFLMLIRFTYFGRFKKKLALLFVVIYLLEIVFLLLMRKNFLNDEIYGFLAILLGFSFFFFIASLFYFVVVFIFGCKNGFKNAVKDLFFPKKEIEGRRKFLKVVFEVWILVVAFSFFFKGLKDALSIPKTKHLTIKSSKIKSDLKIAMVSDLHIGKNLHKDFLYGIVKSLNDLGADCVVIVGDLIDTNIDDIDYLDILNDIKSRYGTFYVFGNHEYYHGIEEIYEKLQAYNINILNNKNIAFEDFAIVGVNDLSGFKHDNDFFKPDLELAKDGFNEHKFNILLTHQPKFVKRYDVCDFDLVLAGHTHAGQIFPFSILVMIEQGFLHGLYELGKNTLMYVSSGAGFWGPSIRFLAPSEIVCINILKEDNV